MHERAVAFLPGLDPVGTGGNVRDFELACSTAHREIRVIDDADIRGHPTVYVALHPHHDFFILQVKLLDHPGSGLADVEPVAVRRQAVHVVQQVVAVPDLQRLACPHPDDARRVDASALIEGNRFSRRRRRLK